MNEFELIEEYLKGKLQGQTLKDFEDKLASNSTFASKVEEHRTMQDMIFTKGLLETREKLQAIRKLKTGKKGGNGSWLKGLYVILLPLVVLTAFLLFKRENTSENIDATRTENLETHVLNDARMEPNIRKEDEILSIKNSPADKRKNSVENSDNIRNKASLSEDEGINGNLNSIVSEKELPNVLPNEPSATIRADTQAINKMDPNPIYPKSLPDPSIPESPCAHVHIKAVIHTEESCQDKATGKINVSQLTGGIAPYKFSLSESEAFRTNSHFDNLNAGVYQIRISDANGCATVLESRIGARLCAPDKSNIFAPDYGETWKFPISPGGNCNIRIYNAVGNMVYEVNTINGFPSEWNGAGDNNNYLKAGAYLFQITCKDGKLSQGSVTITR